MLISSSKSQQLRKTLQNGGESFCSGLFLSARWTVLSEITDEGTHLIILPTREAAEYCSADLYNLTEGDCVFYLPESGRSVEHSNYKSSLGVQRTAAIGQLLNPGSSPLYIVSYPEAIEEKVPSGKKLQDALFTIKSGEDVNYQKLQSKLLEEGIGPGTVRRSWRRHRHIFLFAGAALPYQLFRKRSRENPYLRL